MSAAHTNPIETVETPFARARAHAAKVEGILTSEEMIRKSHSDLEEMLVGQGREWARLMLEENLRLRAQLERETAVVGADGVERGSSRASERHLETLLGRVPAPRLAYLRLSTAYQLGMPDGRTGAYGCHVSDRHGLG